MMQGEITVTTKLGVGSEFKVEICADLPEKSSNLSVASKEVLSELKEKKLRVLLVEDNLINQKVALAFLKDFVQEVDVASTAKEAIELYKKNAYDVVFMDLSLPDGDGISITKVLIRNGAK